MVRDHDVLWSGEFTDLVSPTENPYEMLHESDFVSVLPIIQVNRSLIDDEMPIDWCDIELSGTNYFYLIREEFCPPYAHKSNDNDYFFTTVTGKCEDNESRIETVTRELEEETGVIPIDYNVITVTEDAPIHKSTDARCSFYLLKLTDFNYKIPEGDGSEYERKSKTRWVNKNNINNFIDPNRTDIQLQFAFTLLNVEEIKNRFF